MIALGLEQDQASRGNTVRLTSDDLFRPHDYEACPVGTTAALGVLRRDLAALAEDYDRQVREIEFLRSVLAGEPRADHWQESD